MIVTFTKWEFKLGALIGCERQTEGMVGGMQDKIQCDNGVYDKHVIGALGELACAKAINRYWKASVNTHKAEADIGKNIEVRTVTRPTYQLFVRPDDPDDRYYFLVRALMRGGCLIFDVVGYIRGSDAKQEKWLEPRGGYAAAHFIPDEELTPIEEKPATGEKGNGDGSGQSAGTTAA